MFFFPFLCSFIPDLALETLKILICVCFRDVLQPAEFDPGMIWLSVNAYDKCTVCIVNVCYLQALAMYKKILS